MRWNGSAIASALFWSIALGVTGRAIAPPLENCSSLMDDITLIGSSFRGQDQEFFRSDECC